MPEHTVTIAETQDASARGIAVPLSDRHLGVLYLRGGRLDGFAIADAARPDGLILLTADEALRVHQALTLLQQYEKNQRRSRGGSGSTIRR